MGKCWCFQTSNNWLLFFFILTIRCHAVTSRCNVTAWRSFTHWLLFCFWMNSIKKLHTYGLCPGHKSVSKIFPSFDFFNSHTKKSEKNVTPWHVTAWQTLLIFSFKLCYYWKTQMNKKCVQLFCSRMAMKHNKKIYFYCKRWTSGDL